MSVDGIISEIMGGLRREIADSIETIVLELEQERLLRFKLQVQFEEDQKLIDQLYREIETLERKVRKNETTQ